MDIRSFKSTLDRRKYLEKLLRLNLKNIGSFSLDEKVAETRNCENMIGVAQIPLGVAGPIKINNKKYLVPLATTEGALVASVNRGCKAINMSGGCLSEVKKVGTTRGPVFRIKNILQKDKLESFLLKNFKKLQKIVSSTDPHISLKSYKTSYMGRSFYIRFIFDTQDAMGMNMATIASEKISNFIEKETGAEYVSASGNFCVDKKASWLNFIDGRGFKVWSEVILPEKILKGVLKTTASKIYDIWISKCMLGSIASGSMGFNAHYANVIAAFFIATGQDPAHVVEGSLGVTTCELRKKNLYVSIYLPDVMLGTVGGGTGLATQKEAISILGIKTSDELAKILGGIVLAGEISLLASLSEKTLSKAHQKLARGGVKE